MRRVIVIVSLVLAMTGFMAVLTIEHHLGQGSVAVQDLSFSGSLSSPVETFGLGMGIGTIALSHGSSAVSYVPLYSGVPLIIGTVSVDKRSDKNLSLRDRIVAEISENPGIHLRELLRNVGCAMGALQYHLKNLEQTGVITSIRNGNSKHFFLSDFSSDSQILRLVALMRNPTVRAIISKCRANGRVTQADLSRQLSIDKSLVAYYASALVESGFLKVVPVFGRERPLTLTEYTSSVLCELGVA